MLSRAAHAILPAASFAERSGTFTNVDGRVQAFREGFPPRGRARNTVRILLELADRLGAGWPFRDERAVFEELSRTEAPFRGMTYESLGGQGQAVET